MTTVLPGVTGRKGVGVEDNLVPSRGPPDDNFVPIAVSPRRTAELLGSCIPYIYNLVRTGVLPSYLIGGKRMILMSDIYALFKVPAPLREWHTKAHKKAGGKPSKKLA